MDLSRTEGECHTSASVVGTEFLSLTERDQTLSARFMTRWEPGNVYLRCFSLLQHILFSRKKKKRDGSTR